jgi:2-polyprenyl-3-methyl-5-hydroxy-6-metoxy-1,4-benzoquinol methylase
MSQDVSSCPLCGSHRNSLFDQCTFRDMPLVNRLCQDCGLVYQSPRRTEQEAEEFHKIEYRRLHQAGKLLIDGREIAIQRARAQSMLRIFRQSVPDVKMHLDIGCSAGLLMQAFQEQYGCRTSGVEVDGLYRPYAQQQGLDVYLALGALPAGLRFDVVSLSHVLEHLPDPVEFLARIRKTVLDADGWLFLEVPNLYSHDCFELAHLYSFSSHTLRQVLQQAGYQIIKTVKHGQPRSKNLPLYINVLARPAPAGSPLPALKPERGVHFKRWVGRTVRGWVEFPDRVEKLARRLRARMKRNRR